MNISCFAADFDTRTAVALGNITIVGGALSNFLFNAPRRHSVFNRPLIDWDLILVHSQHSLLCACLQRHGLICAARQRMMPFHLGCSQVMEPATILGALVGGYLNKVSYLPHSFHPHSIPLAFMKP